MNPKIYKKLINAGYYSKEDMERFFNNPPIPSVDNLAEKLGSNFFGLQKRGTAWSAFRDKEVEVGGGTSQDALANLWLKINDK